jgi:hypothetical protein
MPFTFAHPAIVLPLINKRKKIFSSSGLIIGSIIPDFESFIRFDEHKQYSHTWLGIFWFDLPLAIIFAFIFHNIVRDPLIKNLPYSIGSKFYSYIDLNWNAFFRKHFIMVIYSMLIGITSHLLWDSFTHLNLADPNAIDSQIYLGHTRLYILLQYSNSVLGLIVIAWYIIKRETSNEMNGEMVFTANASKTIKNSIQYWILAGVIMCLTMVISINIVRGPLNAILLIDIAISGILLALILTPVILGLAFSKSELPDT